MERSPGADDGRLDDERLKGENMRTLIYTEKAEKRAEALGLEERKAGTVVMIGHKPLQGGMTAQAWKKKGYVIEV